MGRAKALFSVYLDFFVTRLKFQDGAFEDPFLAKFVSDGTIKMLAYLVLLNDPKPHRIKKIYNRVAPNLILHLINKEGFLTKQGYLCTQKFNNISIRRKNVTPNNH
jgi:hypothetical protein